MFRLVLLAIAAVLLPAVSHTQNCSNSSVGLVPLDDLGTGTYQGKQGGLYPAGQNTRPTAHNDAGVQLADRVRPLDVNGNPDDSAGRIVLLSIGMSNTMQEFGVFDSLVDMLPEKNSFLSVVNGAEAGEDIDRILAPETRYWLNVDGKLEDLGLSPLQVQVIWFKEAEAYPMLDGNDTTFLGYVPALKEKFIAAMNIIRSRYPNARVCYVAGRIYGGYSLDDLNPEPFAHYTSWSVKDLIEAQINGDTALTFTGPNPRAPWLSWGVHLWADGLSRRNDGLTWACPDDFLDDGVHPSDTGRLKVAGMLMSFFSTDETTTGWFLESGVPSIPAIPTGLAATIAGSSEIDLSWIDNSFNENGFSIERRTRGVQFSEIATVGAGITAFTNIGLLPSTTYEYRTRAYNPAGYSGYSNTVRARTTRIDTGGDEAALRPEELAALVSNYPNPFNPYTVIRYQLPEKTHVRIQVFNLLGESIATLVDEDQHLGTHEISFDGSHLSSGLYFYRVEAGTFVDTRKFVVLK